MQRQRSPFSNHVLFHNDIRQALLIVAGDCSNRIYRRPMGTRSAQYTGPLDVCAWRMKKRKHSLSPVELARIEHGLVRGWYLRLSVAAVLIALALIGPRAYILRQAANQPAFNLPKTALKAAVSSTYDAALVGGVAAVFFLLLLAVRNKPWASRTIYYLFLLIATLLLLAGIVNVQLLNVLHRPFNYRWLQYSDFLHSVDAREAIKTSITAQLVTILLAGISSYLLISIYWGKRLAQNERALGVSEGRVGCFVVFGFAIWAMVGHWCVTSREWPQEKVANPVYAFAHSWLVSGGEPSLFTMKTPIGMDEFEPPAVKTPAAPLIVHSAIRNVIVFVLESTPAEYLGPYNSRYRVTPNLDRWSEHAVVFENVYAHAPATNKSLFSVLCSLYPWISYKSETEEFDLALPSIASYLQHYGYSTGFFSSGDLSFQRAGNFIRSHGFDFLQDYKQRKISRTIFRDERWPFLNGSDDTSTAESMTSWFEQQHSAGKPVFAMLWTNMTHYPYFTDRVTINFGPEENRFNLYLNALHSGDLAFGAVMKWLEKHDLVKQTLVVVLGDHGEAFGRHNQLTHAGNLYEENCHVPLLLINPELFTAERRATVGGLIDVAPSIVQILGYPSVTNWQGQSLFSSNRRTRTYFFSPWSDYLFGLRQGNTKFIYNATKESYEMYDLSADPKEENNLITAEHRPSKENVLQLAAWVQYQDRLFKRLTTSKKNSDRRSASVFHSGVNVSRQ
jgi:lipoteichoic acid synthase